MVQTVSNQIDGQPAHPLSRNEAAKYLISSHFPRNKKTVLYSCCPAGDDRKLTFQSFANPFQEVKGKAVRAVPQNVIHIEPGSG